MCIFAFDNYHDMKISRLQLEHFKDFTHTSQMRKLVIMLAAMLSMATGMAQYKPGREITPEEVEQKADADSCRWDVHGSIFTGFYSGFGMHGSYYGAAPTFTYTASERLKIAATVFAVGGNNVPSYAPYRDGHAPAMTDLGFGYMGLMAYGGTISLRYKTARDRYLDFHITYINDRGGLMNPMFMDPFFRPSMMHGSFGFWDL